MVLISGDGSLTSRFIHELLQRASQKLTSSERDLLIIDLQMLVDSYEGLVAEQPDRGAAIVLSDLFGADILNVRDLLVRLQQTPQLQKTIGSHINKQAVLQYGLNVDDVFTWLIIGKIDYSKGTIIKICSNGMLDIVLRKRGSSRHYAMKIGAVDFLAGRTIKTRRTVKR